MHGRCVPRQKCRVSTAGPETIGWTTPASPQRCLRYCPKWHAGPAGGGCVCVHVCLYRHTYMIFFCAYVCKHVTQTLTSTHACTCLYHWRHACAAREHADMLHPERILDLAKDGQGAGHGLGAGEGYTSAPQRCFSRVSVRQAYLWHTQVPSRSLERV